MERYKVYEVGSIPLREVGCFVDGEKYVASNGDVLEWDGEVQDFKKLMDSPLEPAFENNTVENLTALQLELFWPLCR